MKRIINICDKKRTRYSVYLAVEDAIKDGKYLSVMKKAEFVCDDGSDPDCTRSIKLVSCENGNMGTLIIVHNHHVNDDHDSRGAEIIDVSDLVKEDVRRVWDYCARVCEWTVGGRNIKPVEVAPSEKRMHISRFSRLPQCLST